MPTIKRRQLDTSATAMLTADLNILRCLVFSGIKAYGVTWEPDNDLLYSRYCRNQQLISSNLTHPADFAADLARIGRSFPIKPVLFYNNDGITLTISRYRDILEPHYRFLMAPAELIEDLVDKTRFANLADRLDIPVPRTLRSEDVTSADAALAKITLPCILKPDSRHHGWKSAELAEEGAGPQKVLVANTPEQFRRMYDSVRQFTNSFVIQPYIPGNDDRIYSFHGYFNRNGEPLGYFVGQKIRTYPKNTGISTYLELAKEPEVVALGLDILRKMNYVGPVKIDFKQDPTTKRLYVLELNPRYTLWNHLGAVSGVNLPLLGYADQTGQPCVPELEWTVGTRWMTFGNDLRTFLRGYHPDGDLSWFEWLRSLAYPKVYDIFAWDDPMPFIHGQMKFVTQVARKLTGRKA